MEKPVGWS